MPTCFSTTRRVEFAETDMAGMVHFAVFFRYLEEAEHAYFRSLGLSIIQDEEDGWVLSWPRVAASCSFDAPAFFEDVLALRLVGLEIGRRSLSFAWEIGRGETRLCSGELKTVCCRFRPGERPKSIDIPDDVRAKLAASLAEETPT
ncbi:MAG: acyl-CoA thioesterase [Planctomycetaceae bacterium]